jgi:NADPH-dependent curcumin reductase CurA
MISRYNKTPDQWYGVKSLLLGVSKRIEIQGFITSDKDFGQNILTRETKESLRYGRVL